MTNPGRSPFIILFPGAPTNVSCIELSLLALVPAIAAFAASMVPKEISEDAADDSKDSNTELSRMLTVLCRYPADTWGQIHA